LAAPQGVGETATDASQPAVPRIVEVRASRRTWLRIENTQGTVLFSSIIRGGESFTLQEDTPYTLATRDAGALHFHVDDEKVGDVGRRGQILTARQIDRAGIIALQN
jgi:cytoskeleton protein RodZ